MSHLWIYRSGIESSSANQLVNVSHSLITMLDIELLISEVEQAPSLWDSGDKLYCDRDEKKKAWNRVASKVFSDWENIEEKEKKTKRE